MQKTKKSPQAELKQLSDLDRLRTDVYRSDMEKFRLLMDMFRRNAMLKKAVIRHK